MCTLEFKKHWPSGGHVFNNFSAFHLTGAFQAKEYSNILVVYKAIVSASDIPLHHRNKYLWSCQALLSGKQM